MLYISLNLTAKNNKRLFFIKSPQLQFQIISANYIQQRAYSFTNKFRSQVAGMVDTVVC